MEDIATTRQLFNVDDVNDPTSEVGREALLSAALADGRLIAASVPSWRVSLERSPAKAAAQLASLAAPTTLAGAGGDADMDRLFPGVATSLN